MNKQMGTTKRLGY